MSVPGVGQVDVGAWDPGCVVLRLALCVGVRARSPTSPRPLQASAPVYMVESF